MNLSIVGDHFFEIIFFSPPVTCKQVALWESTYAAGEILVEWEREIRMSRKS